MKRLGDGVGVRRLAPNPTTDLDGPDVPRPGEPAPAVPATPITHRRGAALGAPLQRALPQAAREPLARVRARGRPRRAEPAGPARGAHPPDVLGDVQPAGDRGSPRHAADRRCRPRRACAPVRRFRSPTRSCSPRGEAGRWRLHRDILDAAAAIMGQLRDTAAPDARDYLAALAQMDATERRPGRAARGRQPGRGRRGADAMIEELRILPPLAIARFGAAPAPMDNYDAVVDPEQPLGLPRAAARARPSRSTMRPARSRGRSSPTSCRSRRTALVRPVAPFLEVWALTDAGQLEPLTIELLRAEGATPADVRWRVEVANLKAERRTDDPRDRIEADRSTFADHARHALDGTCENFWPGKSIPFGHVRYIRPTAAHPEIRLRFTPGAGHVYGASRAPAAGRSADPERRRRRLRRQPRRLARAHRPHGARRHGPRAHLLRRRGRLRREPRLPRRRLRRRRAREPAVGGRTLHGVSAGSAPVRRPTRPTPLPIRSVADELEQALLGPGGRRRRGDDRARRGDRPPRVRERAPHEHAPR